MLEGLDYTILNGPEIAAGEVAAERDDTGYRDVILNGDCAKGRWSASIPKLPPRGPGRRIQEADRSRRAVDGDMQPCFAPRLVEASRWEYTRPDGSIAERWFM